MDGAVRRYLVAQPAFCGRGGRKAVLLAFHGEGDSAAKLAAEARLQALGAAHSVVVVYPEGLDYHWAVGPVAGKGGGGESYDVAFVRQILQEIAQLYPSDPLEVGALGYSQGGEFVYTLASALGDRISSIAVISATPAEGAAVPSAPVALLHIHGTHDRVYPFSGVAGRDSRRGARLGVPETISRWLGCDDTLAGCLDSVQRGEGLTMVARRAAPHHLPPVELQVLAGWGHHWPGSRRLLGAGELPSMISFDEKILEFFEPYLCSSAQRASTAL